MRAYRFDQFGLEHLKLVTAEQPTPGPGEVLVEVKALSLNYRDLMVVKGWYNPKLRLPATPISDGAGVILALGQGVERVKVGDRVTSHFVAGWIDGPPRAEHATTTLGAPGAGLAAEQVVLPAEAVVPVPAGYDYAQAATLPIAALTAWSALRTISQTTVGDTVLTLGTGGVSIFALQFAKQMGVTVIITSSSDEKLEWARGLCADHLINYRSRPDWDQAVLEATRGVGADLTIESGGVGTLEQSMRATRAGGTIAYVGALTGLKGELNTAPILMRRLHVAGVFVDSRAEFEKMNRFIEEREIKPIISRKFTFDQLPDAFRLMESGGHFGKIVVEL
jgi:NADPH:quinone reductase-like Zn-dependent oxidoreductase